MKICIAQQSYIIGDFNFNFEKMRLAINEAKKAGVSIIIFGELSISGYGHYDDIFYASFLDGIEDTLKRLLTLADGITIICGAPKRTLKTSGKPFQNVAYVLQDKQVKHTIVKTLLPYFDIFEEEKYFQSSLTNTHTINIEGKSILLNVCADMWAYQKPNLYTSNPIRNIISKSEVDFIINISASPYHYGRLTQRKEVIANIVNEHKVPMIYCNIVGAYDETIFDGQSLVFDAFGRCVVTMRAFKEDRCIIDMNQLSNMPVVVEEAKFNQVLSKDNVLGLLKMPEYISSIYEAITFSLKSFFNHLQVKRVIVASSGGIDSALCLALLAQVLPKESCLSVNFPSQWNSTETQLDAQLLADNLGIEHKVFPIEDYASQVSSGISPNADLKTLTKENLQSRIRSLLLMTLANEYQALTINTSNKSELSTGYGTLYGDMVGAISPLGDLFKVQVFALAEYLINQGIPIPMSIVNRPPSAELSANQQDEDTLPPYDLLDSILYFFIHKSMDRRQLIDLGFEPDVVNKVILLFKQSIFKRKQFCPIIRLSDKAFGQGKKHLITSNFFAR